MSIAEIAPSAVKIDKLLHRLEEGDIKIPAFQRGFVWKQNQIIDLLDSIYNDYPIGSVLLWNSNERLRSSRNVGGFAIPDREPQYPVNYVLDGQQRLTVIYGMFCKNRTWATDSANYKVDPTLFDIFFDLTDRKFVPEQDLLPGHTSLRLSYLFRVQDFLAQCQQYSDEETNVAQDLLSKFQNYEIPVVTTYKRTKEEVGIIFERINNTGTKLTAFDLMIAWTWSEDFHLREEIDGILDVLDQKGFGDTDDKIVLQCLSAIINKTTRTKDILALDPDRVKESVSLLKDSLEKTIDFLSTELNVVTSDFLPQSHQLIPLTYFFFKVNNPSASQSKLLKQWFWRTAFSLRYSGAIDSRLNQDFALFDGIIAEEAVTLEKYQSLPPEKILIETPFTRTNVYTRSFLLLMAQSQPLNLTNGNKVDIGQALSKYNSKEYHHIFPKAFLVEKNVASQRINSICNFCFLPADSNKKISRRAPSDYFFNTIPPIFFDSIMKSNLMPIEKEIYKKDDFEAFLKRRAEVTLQFLEGIVQ